MHFASHLRSERLGEFTVGHRPAPLALARDRPAADPYHLVTARAAVALGGESTRVDRDAAALIEQV